MNFSHTILIRPISFYKCFAAMILSKSALLLLGFALAASTLPTQMLLGQSFNRSVQAPAKKTVVILEISSNSSAGLGSQQRWMKMLQDVGADRVSSKTIPQGAAGVEESELRGTRLIKIRGFIENSKLVLPSGSYRLSDSAKIRDLLQKFRDDGTDTTLAEKHDFGLTRDQLIDLATKFANPVAEPTKGKPLLATVDAIALKTGLTFVRDPSARSALSGEEKVTQEFKGMASGTALAALVKPLGLVVEPSREQGQQVKVHIKRAQDSKQSWPIGREPESSPSVAEPKLFAKMPIGIKNFPLDKVMEAVQKKAGLPFIYDEQAITAEGVDVAKTKVSITNKNGVLMVMIGRLLRQTTPKSLTKELRVDDAGQTFLWITTR